MIPFFADRFPVASPDFLLLMEVICKNFLSANANMSTWQFVKVLEVTVHKYKDDFDSLLVYFQVKPGGETQLVEMEIAVLHVEPPALGNFSSFQTGLSIWIRIGPEFNGIVDPNSW
jgi:hypothetical protein